MTANFEWDEEKASLNLKKHGISFNEAITVFEDPYSILMQQEDSRLCRCGELLQKIKPRSTATELIFFVEHSNIDIS